MCPSLACCVVVSIATAGCAEDCTTATAAYTTALNGDCTTTASTACSPISTPGGPCPDGIQAKVDNMYVECGGCGEWCCSEFHNYGSSARPTHCVLTCHDLRRGLGRSQPRYGGLARNDRLRGRPSRPTAASYSVDCGCRLGAARLVPVGLAARVELRRAGSDCLACQHLSLLLVHARSPQCSNRPVDCRSASIPVFDASAASMSTSTCPGLAAAGALGEWSRLRVVDDRVQ